MNARELGSLVLYTKLRRANCLRHVGREGLAESPREGGQEWSYCSRDPDACVQA